MVVGEQRAAVVTGRAGGAQVVGCSRYRVGWVVYVAPAVVKISKGCHDSTYWSSQAPTDLHLIGTALGSPVGIKLDSSAARIRT